MPFKKVSSRYIAVMQAEVQVYEDIRTGARHIHLANDDHEYVFLVGFATVPDASDGRAHILEHLALCGSRRYPVRDPFFAMTRRSTSHFMNAMTYTDKTVYPFASTDKTDFFNLLDVYLDAAFFPKLEYLDFLQEGWRLELNGERLAYQGIVFNEMKGAFSDPVRALDAGIASELLAGTTYAFESGGDPLEIPDLSYEALKRFHATHYHPSRATFMTAGKLDLQQIQDLIETNVLSHFEDRLPRLFPNLAPEWPEPKAVDIMIPARDHGVQFAWLLGEASNVEEYYEAILLDTGLLGNSAAPLAHAMESAGYGRPSAMNGADTGMRQIVFHLGMEGLREDQVRAARNRIWTALEQVAKEGVPSSLLQAALRDLRFRQREISGGSMPNAMRRLLRAMPYEMYGGDIMNGFDNEDMLRDLQDRIKDGAYFKRLVQKLIERKTRLDATAVPDPAFFEKRNRIEESKLRDLEKSLSPEEKERLRSEAAALQERQRLTANNDVLPKITPQDVSREPTPLPHLPAPEDGAIAVSIPSNGVSYARVLFDVTTLEPEAWQWLQLYAELVPDLGVGKRSYHEADAWRHDKAPFFDINVYVVQKQDEARSLGIYLDFYAKGLSEENAGIAEVITESINVPRFDEHDRLAFLIDSAMQDMRDELAESGDEYARLAATSPISPLRYYEEQVRGAAYLRFFRGLHKQSLNKAGKAKIAQRLSELHARIVGSERLVLAAASGAEARLLAAMIKVPRRATETQADINYAIAQLPLAKAGLHAPAQVNHCYSAWRAPTVSHPDAPALAVLGELMTNLVLHPVLREEGGAYGGQAAYSAESNSFVMMSYRDPGLASTYAAFDRAVTWATGATISQENLDEAIICVIQSLDKPRTPFEAVMWSWEQAQRGITEDIRRSYRQGVLNCTAARLREVASTWLLNKPASRAAFIGNPGQDRAGLQLIELDEVDR